MSQDAEGPAGPLPAPVRLRVLALAAEALGAMPLDDVPNGLKAVARFAPAKRARTGATPLAAAVEKDPVFRQQVAARLAEREPDLAAAVAEGGTVATVEPVEVAAATYLLRPPGWVELLDRSIEAIARDERVGQDAESASAVDQLQEQLAAVRSQTRTELDRARAEATAARREVADLRRQLRVATDAARRAEATEREATAAAEQARAEASGQVAAAEQELRRLRSRLTDAQAAVEGARKAAREGRAGNELRLRLLLDTVLDAAAGLRRELALPPASGSPADAVQPGGGEPATGAAVATRAQDHDDPARLEQLLLLPKVHLVVDGYNVTKSGYGTLPLETQRTRLVGALGTLAARTGAEVTCVFDGATVEVPVGVPVPRGVRVLFSAAGETADELIRRLVRAEPRGRPVVVVSSDREVMDGVAAAGAWTAAAVALLRRLDRG
ncbi:MAG TPA: NYN domain-containing protein [Actinomycetes bacterium]